MKRIVKDPIARRAEILEAAGELFQAQGYAHTTVDAIIQKVGVAKGTFYYYFKSKEEILDAYVQSIIDSRCEDYKKIAEDASLPVMEKLRHMLRGQEQQVDEQSEWLESLHRPENRELHERLNTAIIVRIAPVLAQVIEQGNRESVLHVEDALETVQFLLAGSQFLLESGIFQWGPDEQRKRTQVMQVIIERSLGAAPGSFSFLSYG